MMLCFLFQSFSVVVIKISIGIVAEVCYRLMVLPTIVRLSLLNKANCCLPNQLVFSPTLKNRVSSIWIRVRTLDDTKHSSCNNRSMSTAASIGMNKLFFLKKPPEF